MVDVQRREKSLQDYCQFLKGVGPSRAQKLAKLGIENVNDLLTHYPRKYYDRRNLAKVAQLQPGGSATVLAQVLTATQRHSRRRRAMVTAAVGDDTGVLQVVWFNQPYLARHLKPGTEIIMSGELSFYRGNRQMVNPEFEVIGDDLDQTLLAGGRIVPVYGLTRGVSQRFLRTVIVQTLDAYRDHIDENLPPEITEAMGLPSRYESLRAIHLPEDEAVYLRAVERLKIEELYYVQLLFSLQRRQRLASPSRFVLDGTLERSQRFVASLPFELTDAQKRVLGEIREDIASPKGLNRLLQGDVGSGKTVVAGAAMLAAVDGGYQTALMVPTEILAAQHYETLRPYFEALGVPVGLLVGSRKASEKRRVQEEIAKGALQVVIGTHALIQQNVHFPRLALVVIDEQHRFGVRQRAALLSGEHAPHMLVMTATPIPRTLALTAYADLDLSVLDEMPATRAPVKTHTVPPEKRDDMYAFIRREVQSGAQAFFLYPLIEETEKQDLEAAVVAYQNLADGVYKDVPVGLVHGKLPAAEKEQAMADFSAGRTRILVATTVVEVGVHIPDATIMVVHHPERFGLSQLHQLRGRVGRGGMAGYCFLLLGENHSAETRERLAVMVRESDGFRIAEEDLRIRGPGEFLGVRQHGVPGFKLANPLRDRRLVERANDCVKALLESDPALKTAVGKRCRRHLRTIVDSDVAAKTVV